MKTLRFGIVGYGWVAGAHIASFEALEGCEVTAVCSRRQIPDEEFVRNHGKALRLYNDYDAMLADEAINVVSVCTPHPYHVEQVEKACAAGKHVVIEKPVALDWDGCKRVQTAVGAAGVKAQVCFEVRMISSLLTYKKMLAEGVLGPIHYGEADYYHGIGPWYGQYAWNIKKEMGGSSLLTAGCHALDALIWLMEDEPEEVMSYATTSSKKMFQDYEYPTSTCTLIKFKGGAVGKVASIIDCIQPYLFNIHLCGENGSIWNEKFHTDRFGALDKTDWSRLCVQLADSGDVGHHPYVPLFQDFVNAIREDREPGLSLESAILTHKTCLAADLSAERGNPVKLAELG